MISIRSSEQSTTIRCTWDWPSKWRIDPILKPYYHETGILFAGILEPGLRVVENFKRVAGRSPASILEPEHAKKQFDGVFPTATGLG